MTKEKEREREYRARNMVLLITHQWINPGGGGGGRVEKGDCSENRWKEMCHHLLLFVKKYWLCRDNDIAEKEGVGRQQPDPSFLPSSIVNLTPTPTPISTTTSRQIQIAT